MRHTKLVLYNRYAKSDKGETVKEPKEEHFSRGLCLITILVDKKFKDFDSFILSSDKMYVEKNVKRKPNVPETFRIWRITIPILNKLGTEIPEYLR